MTNNLCQLPKTYKPDTRHIYVDRHAKFVPDKDRNVMYDKCGRLVRDNRGCIIYTDNKGHRFTMKNRNEREYIQPQTLLDQIFAVVVCIIAIPFMALEWFFNRPSGEHEEPE